MTAVVTDADDDGWPDVYVACDSTAAILYHNNRNGTFSDLGVESGSAYSEDGQAQAGMGVTTADFNGDGLVDIFKTHFSDDLPGLYRNRGGGLFEDASRASGFELTRYVEWGVAAADFDNDGWPDIIIATGNVYPEVEKAFKEYPHRGPRLVYRNLGDGRFRDVTAESGAGALAPRSSRGCAFGDFDNDGDVDVLVMNMNEPPLLMRNDLAAGQTANHWLSLHLVGTKSNRSAVGARVRITCGSHVQAMEVTSQSSYYSHDDDRLHFGLGASAKADAVEIRWPSGAKEVLHDVAGDRFLTVVEGTGAAKETAPGAGRRR
jgi:hypothetical protein